MRKSDLGSLLRSHLGSKLVLNAYIIMAMRLFAGASGFVFWAATARLLPAADVGLASAVVAASMLLASLAQLGLGYGLVRHLPDSETPARLINSVLLTVGVNGGALAGIFLLGLQVWSPALLPVRANGEAAAAFGLLTISTGLTQLLNWHFLARRTPVYSLVKNTLQSGLAIVLLIVLALGHHDYLAAVWAYTLATVAGLVAAIVLYLPRTEPGYVPQVVVPRTFRTSFARYSLTNFAADQFTRMANTVMPLLVINVLGADAAAYFSIVWSLAAGLSSIDESVSSSLFAESANDRDRLQDFTWKSTRLTLAISAVVTAGTVVFSRLVLSIYGPRYVEHSFWPLIIVAAALVPYSVVPIWDTYLRVRDQLVLLILFSAADIGLGILGTYLFMIPYGLNGVAIGWLISRFAVLALILVLWRSGAQIGGHLHNAGETNRAS
ncbi:MAG TPA: oligosaccharide flippase family protein [Anaerolineae bacterium]